MAFNCVTRPTHCLAGEILLALRSPCRANRCAQVALNLADLSLKSRSEAALEPIGNLFARRSGRGEAGGRGSGRHLRRARASSGATLLARWGRELKSF